jgi:hypothetical protein
MMQMASLQCSDFTTYCTPREILLREKRLLEENLWIQYAMMLIPSISKLIGG